jgi:4-hydroxybenzoate polyprenyltransferase
MLEPMRKVLPYLHMMRPPNLLTAVSDIWAGIALSGFMMGAGSLTNYWPSVVMLSIASICLYGGGVVLNDVCDTEIDKIERPERPIPSGQVSKSSATILGIVLLLAGILISVSQSLLSGSLALLISAAAVIYDRWGKHHSLMGPLNMGLCRGLNLLLGMSILPASIPTWGWIAVVPVIYIAAITLISRGEVHGGSRQAVITALVFYILVILSVISVGILKHRLLITVVFLIPFAAFIFPPLLRAIKNPSGRYIGKAVKAGVLGLILMNTSWVAAGNNVICALATALLLPASVLIARSFAVT